jgi:protocatechuate 3,4-dioxygenase beta subunit
LLGLIGAGAAAWCLRGLAARPPLPACVVRPEQTEGPYFVDTRLARSDIRADPDTGLLQPGIPIQVTFEVSRLERGRCAALPNAQVELWQCNARGVYSGVRDPQFETTGQRFLRGYQVTDENGRARFVTIYPGWYPGRTVHLHFMIRTGPSGARREEFTSQLYFDDTLSDQLFQQPPYAERGPRPVRNADDGIYHRGGSQLLLPVRQNGGSLQGRFAIALERQ